MIWFRPTYRTWWIAIHVTMTVEGAMARIHLEPQRYTL